MSYGYSHLNQGYNGSGGVPYNNTPTLPNINTPPHMQEHLPAIASAIYHDMNRRNTTISSYLATAMAENTYHNDLFGSALQLTADYVEYLMGAQRVMIHDAINLAVPLINDFMGFNYVSQYANARSMASHQEISMFNNAAQKINALKPEIKNFLTRGNQFGHSNRAGYGHVPNRASQVLRSALNTTPPPPHAHFPSQNRYNQNVETRVVYVDQYGRPLEQPPMPQTAPNRMNPGAYATDINRTHVHHGVNPRTQTDPSLTTNLWTANPNTQDPRTSGYQQSASRQHDYNQPPVPDFTGYKPLSQPTSRVVENKSPSSNLREVPNYASLLNSNARQQNAGINNNSLADYERRVRQFAKDKELPYLDMSLEALEFAITHMYPDNGFIDPNNSFRNGNLTTTNVKSSVDRDQLKQFISKTEDLDLKELASKSKGELVKNEYGDYVWLKEAGNMNSGITRPNVSSAPESIKSYVQNELNSPYPFARLNSKAQWFIAEEDFYKLPMEKRPLPYNGAIGKCMMRDLYFIVDDNGVVIDDFSTVKPEYQTEYEEIFMNKEQHDYRRFFNVQTLRDNIEKVDYTKAIEAFANAQNQEKIDECIERLEAASDAVKENGVLQISDITLQSPKLVKGEVLYDDYVSRANILVDELVDDKAEVSNCSTRFVHVNLSDTLVSNEFVKVARKLNSCSSWKEIVDVVNTLDEFEGSGVPKLLNERATNYVNNKLISMFGIYPTQFYMESFVMDILDVQEEMESLGHGEAFNVLAAKLATSLLYCFDTTSNVFKEIIGDATEDGEEIFATFGIVRDVTVLPISSNYILLNGEKKRAVVTEGAAPQLYGLIKKTIESAHPRASEVLIVTSDNRVMYVTKTANSNSFAVTQQSVLEPTYR